MARKSVTVPVKRLPSESERDAQKEERRRLRRRRGRYRWRDSTRSGRLNPNSERSDYKSFVKVNTRAQTFLMSARHPEFFICSAQTRDTTCK